MITPRPTIGKKEMPPSPLPSFATIRLDEDEEEAIDDDNDNSHGNDSDDDKDNFPRLESKRSDSLNRNRSLDDTMFSDNDKDFQTLELERENERLRTELLLMRNKLARVKSKLKEQQLQQQYNSRVLGSSQHSPMTSLHENYTVCSGGVLLELPSTFRNQCQKGGVGKNDGSLQIPSGSGKDHQSVSTTDERSAVETNIDLEAHQSGAGLHHRGDPKNKLQPSKNNNSLQTLKTSPTTDDSLSSSNSYDDEELERLVEAHGAMNNNHVARSEADGVMRNPRRTSGTGAPDELPFCKRIADRAGWLVGLLVFQSLSSFILARNESLLQHHAVIVQFLTMLVGAGGNAGNQASVGVVRGLAVGTIDRSNVKRFLRREFAMALALSIIIGIAGFVRAAVFAIPWLETMAITSSLFMIVIISVVTGAMLPLGMHAVGIDPAHSSTTIQVIMDITGVVITVHVSSLILDTDFRFWLENAFSLVGETG